MTKHRFIDGSAMGKSAPDIGESGRAVLTARGAWGP